MQRYDCLLYLRRLRRLHFADDDEPRYHESAAGRDASPAAAVDAGAATMGVPPLGHDIDYATLGLRPTAGVNSAGAPPPVGFTVLASRAAHWPTHGDAAPAWPCATHVAATESGFDYYYESSAIFAAPRRR